MQKSIKQQLYELEQKHKAKLLDYSFRLKVSLKAKGQRMLQTKKNHISERIEKERTRKLRQYKEKTEKKYKNEVRKIK